MSVLGSIVIRKARNSASIGRFKTFKGGRLRVIQATRSLSCMEMFIRKSEEGRSSAFYPGVEAKIGRPGTPYFGLNARIKRRGPPFLTLSDEHFHARKRPGRLDHPQPAAFERLEPANAGGVPGFSNDNRT